MLCTQTRARALMSGPPRSTAPTCRSDRDRGGADRPALADGELAGGVDTTSSSPATRRTRCTKRRHRRSSEWGSTARMAERWRGSPTAGHLWPRQGIGRSARGSRGQGGAHTRERKEKGGVERGCPRERSSPMSSAALRRAIAAGSSLTTSNGDEHRLRDVEAELRARWRGRQ